ncbi:hypothetical protein [Aliikangiella coralliicola]|uniref:Uncharacterized protein n=1 Tax=Aliikangiella coralliicola TaxID=2592383 RepID=A0A545U072_9GAMM|nr:hypothetical protein [Aliikangiella coralliicola]TQV82861.1 hypothetical protein FLL46_24130 [Aliikangiella coralliicola]
MTRIRINSFGGIAPRQDPLKLRGDQAQVANNCRLFSGSLESWRESIDDVNLPSIPTTIFRYAANQWLQWNSDVDVVRSPVPDDQFGRVYWTGDGDPKMGVAGEINAASPYPTDSYTLGIPAPATKPSGALNAHSNPASGASEEEQRTVFYVFTYVSAYGEEGPPSPISDEFEPNELQRVDLSNLVNPGAGDHNITTKRIYRTLEGEYVFVADIPLAQTTYIDEIKDSETGGPLVSEEWYSPSATLEGLISLPNGVLAGFKGNEIRLSEPYVPHAWPPSYSLTVDYEIVGLAKLNSSIVVLTKGFPYISHGIHPSAYSLEAIEINQACISKKSIVEAGSSVLYASPDGLVRISGGASVLTEPLMKKKEWQALNPSSIVGVFHDQRYYGFYDATANGGFKAGFIIDPTEPQAGLTQLTQYSECLYLDLEEDSIFFTEENSTQIKIWDEALTLQTYTWRSKVFVTPRPVNFGWLEIRARGYPVNFKVFADGNNVFEGTITSRDAIRMPAGFLADEWEIEVSGTERINSITLAQSARELRDG